MKSFILRLSLCLSLFASLMQTAFSNNYHDHIYAIPLAKDFSSQVEAVLALKPKSQGFSNFFENEQELSAYLQETFSLNPESVTVILKEKGMKTTIKDLFEKIGGDPKKLLEKMLVANVKSSDHFAAYKNAEKFRLRLLLSLDALTVQKIFESYFASEPLPNRSVMDVSISLPLEEPAQRGKLMTLLELAKKNQSALSFFASIPRQNLEKEAYQIPPVMEELRVLGSIKGVDISGSITEVLGYSTEVKSELIRKNLTMLVSYASEHGLALRIHAFEGANSGPFYDAFKEVFRNYKGPSLELRIGHIAKLSKEWCDFLKSLPTTITVKIEANIASNMYLNSSVSLVDLRKNIDMAKEYSFPVFLGSDGRGILEGSSYLEQKELLELPESSPKPFLFFFSH